MLTFVVKHLIFFTDELLLSGVLPVILQARVAVADPVPKAIGSVNSPKITKLPPLDICMVSIVATLAGFCPPMMTARVGFAHPIAEFTVAAKPPKSMAFPFDAIVTVT